MYGSALCPCVGCKGQLPWEKPSPLGVFPVPYLWACGCLGSAVLWKGPGVGSPAGPSTGDAGPVTVAFKSPSVWAGEQDHVPGHLPSGRDSGPQQGCSGYRARGGGHMPAGGSCPGLSGSPSPPDCETLIRRMLVVDPAKRITIAQIRQHRWMQAEPSVPRPPCPAFPTLGYTSSLGHYDEQVLGVMHSLGIDRQRTVEVSTPPAPAPRVPRQGRAPCEKRALAHRAKTGTWANLRASCPLL